MKSMIAILFCFANLITHTAYADEPLLVTNVVWNRLPVGGEFIREILIGNSGQEDVILKELLILSDDSNGAFKPSSGKSFTEEIAGDTLKPNSTRIVAVRYKPLFVGAHEMTLRVVGEILGGGQTSAEFFLSGSAMEPKLLTFDIDFGLAQNGDTVTKTLSITNAYYEFTTDAVITDFIIGPEGDEISGSGSPGSEGFSYDKVAVFKGQPSITLIPGATLTIPIKFSPVKTGKASATFTPVYNGSTAAVSTWTAEGVITSKVATESEEAGSLRISYPSQDLLRIEFPAALDLISSSLKLYTSLGEELHSLIPETGLAGHLDISTVGLPGGIYFLHYTNAGRSIVETVPVYR